MNAAPQSTPLSPRERLALSATLALALLARLIDMRLFHIYAPDQEYSIGLAQMDWGGMLRTTISDTHPPFYYALLKVWYWFTPDTLAWGQALSLVFAAATLYLTFRLGRELFGQAAGWVALIAMAAAPYQVYWQHVARNHQLQPIAIALVVLWSYRFLARPGRGAWTALAAAWVLAIQTNYMGLVSGLTWGAAFLLAERAPWRRKLALAAAPIPGLLSFAPWVGVLRSQVHGGPMNHSFFQETVSPIYLYYHSLFGTMDYYQPNQAGLGFLALLLGFTLVVVFGARAVGARWSWWVLLIGLPTVPIVLAKWRHWTMAERHLAFCHPVFTAYWGAAAVTCWSLLRRRLAQWHGSAVNQSEAREIPSSQANFKP